MNKKHHIVIIGAGQIGSRHLQALAHLDDTYKISVIDPSDDSLRVAKDRFEEVKTNDNNPEFFKSIDNIDNEIDVAIIATTANIRKRILIDLLSKKDVKFLILEKVVFQSNDDFIEVEILLKKHEIQTWVNCPRRMWDVYKQISTEISGEYPISISVTGSNIGIGCNGLHYLDLFAYLIKDANITLYSNALTDSIYESSRKGYVEFYGNLFGNSEKSTISIVSYELDNIPITVKINTPFKQYILNESKRTIMTSEKNDNWEWKTTDFKMLYQSQLSHIVVEDLINNKTCGLTQYAESMRLHKPFLDVLINHYNKFEKNGDNVCPIT